MSQYGTGYPRCDGDRILRDPHEERALRDLSEASDPDAPSRPDSPAARRQYRKDQRAREPVPRPVVTLTPPPKRGLRPMPPPPTRQYPHFYQDQGPDYQPSRDSPNSLPGFKTMFPSPVQDSSQARNDPVDNPTSDTANQTYPNEKRRAPHILAVSGSDSEKRKKVRAEFEEAISKSMPKEVQEVGGWTRFESLQRRTKRQKKYSGGE